MDKVIYKQNRDTRDNSKKETELPKFLSSWIVQIAFVVVSVILLYSVYKSISITSQKLDILNQAEKEVEELRLKNLYLSIEMKDMATDQYLETEARNRLNFGADGEIVFVLPQSSMQLAREEIEKILSEDIENRNASNSLSLWIDFVLKGI